MISNMLFNMLFIFQLFCNLAVGLRIVGPHAYAFKIHRGFSSLQNVILQKIFEYL